MIIINSKIITMTDIDYDNGYLLVENGKIKAIGNMDNCPEISSEEIIDAKGMYVLPGFVDGHCHLGMWEDATGFEGEDGNEMTEPVTPQLRSIDAIYHADKSFEEAREWGVTTVLTGPGSANVIGGQFCALKTYGKSVDDMVLKAPAAMKVAFGENPKTVYNEKRMMPSTRMATAAILREQLFKAREYLELWEEYYEDTEENEKPEFDIKLDALIPVLKKELVVKAHAHRTDDILTAIRIAKEFDIDMTIEHCTEGHLISDIIKNEGYDVLLGPLLTDRSKIELKNLSLKAPSILAKNGIDVSIITDHPVIPIQHLLLCAMMAVREGMPEKEALKAITINPAKACRIDNRVGSIVPGKDADIVIFTGYPMDFRSKVYKTFINGKLVYSQT